MHLSVDLFPRDPSLEAFVNHWSRGYRDADRDASLYEPNILKDLETERLALWPLFEWKNGTRLSDAKRETVRINYVERWKLEQNLEQCYLDPAQPGHRAVWNIFYLHCRRPDVYPIYDQHTYRAMRYMTKQSIAEIPGAQAQVYATYSIYRGFVDQLSASLQTMMRETPSA
ncbi:hypothetical protein I6F36_20315 [Bradyrhizobium sp. BRP19]|uniref:hypothetical protein n=1 Tax=Bradyrhizobium sp. BRP19 TaxID=2793823 RepID=UPI001CD7BEEB|nr:hypothetical protein [Bradyrhizobium sp. BRP19]MCA1549177.1 hypothetical protein [Bradyrhizobium sp. BRP19]